MRNELNAVWYLRRWAIESLEACMHAEWPAELLNDELGEEQRIAQPMLNR